MANLELNSIPIQELYREIGNSGRLQLAQLGFWLQLRLNAVSNWERNFIRRRFELQEWFRIPPRLAASILCKSEAEIFGRSKPRFSIRLSFNGSAGFVNVRRLATLAGQLQSDKLVQAEFTRLVLSAPCIADAFLVPPKWSASGWHILTAPLGKACGEIEPGEPDVLLTPYARHMKPGGGMCAQAACFMASALQPVPGTPVRGLPEITMIAVEKPGSANDVIEFEGLFTDELAAYFNSKHCKTLGASWQAAKILFDSENSAILADARSVIALEFQQALLSYIRSGMPIILPVDVGRMEGIGNASHIEYTQVKLNGTQKTLRLEDPLNTVGHRLSIFERNGLQKRFSESMAREILSHVVLVVGCADHGDTWIGAEREQLGRKQGSSDIQFCFNDPAHFPFMRATAHELLLAACYEDASHKLQPEFTSLSLGWFLPITPRQARMPFLDEASGPNAGIKSISKLLREIGFRFARSRLITEPLRLVGGGHSEFRLVKATRDAVLTQLRMLLGSLDSKADEFVERTFPEDKLASNVSSWCWIQREAGQIFIWKAEETISKDELEELDRDYCLAGTSGPDLKAIQEKASRFANRLLLAVRVRSREWWKAEESEFEQKPDCLVESKSITGCLLSSVHSSCETVRGFPISEIPIPYVPIEQYVFMQSIADQLLLTTRQRISAFAHSMSRYTFCKITEPAKNLVTRVVNFNDDIVFFIEWNGNFSRC